MRRVKTTIRVMALLGIAILSDSVDAKQPKQITLAPIGRYSAGPGIERAEIAAYDPATNGFSASIPRWLVSTFSTSVIRAIRP